MPCFRNIPVAKKFIGKRGGWEISRLSIEIFLSHSAKNFRRGSLYCCNKFGCRKNLDNRGGEGYQDFPSKFFCLTVPKNLSTMESFSVWLISGIERLYASEGYVTIF